MARNEIENIKKNEMTVAQTYSAVLDSCFDLFKGYEVNFTSYQKQCGITALTYIDQLLKKENISFDDSSLKFSSIKQVVSYCATYELNAEQKEVRISMRNEKQANNSWQKVIEVSPMIKGTLKIITNKGVDVKKVYKVWIVKEGDEYTPPKYSGINIVPPCWSPLGKSNKVVRVVVPIEDIDGNVEYYIAERESVATNLKAQIQQSLLTFSKDDKTLALRIYEKMRDMTLDEILNDKELIKYVNKTYSGISSEEMITTKLIGNAIKRIQINYNNEIERELNERTFDNADVYKSKQKLTELENQEQEEKVKELEQVENVEQKEDNEEIKADDDGVVNYESDVFIFGD